MLLAADDGDVPDSSFLTGRSVGRSVAGSFGWLMLIHYAACLFVFLITLLCHRDSIDDRPTEEKKTAARLFNSRFCYSSLSVGKRQIRDSAG